MIFLLPGSESAACSHGGDFACVAAAICSSFKGSVGEVKPIVVGGTQECGGVQGCAALFSITLKRFSRETRGRTGRSGERGG